MHSEEIQELLGTPPKWFFRWGTLAITIVLLGTLVACMMVRYPIKVEGKLILTTETPPTPVAVKERAIVAEVFVRENEEVAKDSLLLILENTARYRDVKELEQLTQQWLTYDNDFLQDVRLRKSYRLGGIQVAYTRFEKELLAFQNGLNTDDEVINETSSERRKISDLQINISTLERQISQDKKKLRQLIKRRENKKDLFVKGHISSNEYNAYVEDVKEKERDISDAQANIKATKAQIDVLESSIKDTRTKVESSAKDKDSEVKNALFDLQKAIAEWKSKFVVIAPVSGRVTFYNSQLKGALVTKDEEVLAILPDEKKDNFIGTMELPTIGSGKVEADMPVRVKFESYPYLEYGFVLGEVQRKAYLPSPEKEVYDVKIAFPKGLKTNKGDTIPFKQQMHAHAEIIMEEKNLLQRVFASLVNLFG